MARLPVQSKVKAARTVQQGDRTVKAGSHGIVTADGRARCLSRTTCKVVFTPVGVSGARVTLTGLTARDVRPL